MRQLDDIEADEVMNGQQIDEAGLAVLAAGTASRAVDRRTLLVGAAGALAFIGLPQPAHATGYATRLAASHDPRFDPVLARRLREVLQQAQRHSSTHYQEPSCT